MCREHSSLYVCRMRTLSLIIAIKLIYFGLVTFIEEGKVFNIFSGTLEYCMCSEGTSVYETSKSIAVKTGSTNW